MHYLEDLIEFLDDLPEELQHRLNQVREWDAAVEEMQHEVKDMQEQIFSKSCVATKEEKEKIALSIADKFGTMKLLSKKKHELVERCTVLLQKLYTRAHESQEAFEAELAVDNPGVVEAIQSRFNRQLAARQYEEMFSSEAATPFESDESGRSTPDVLLVPNLLDQRNVLKEQNSKHHLYGKGKQFLVDTGKKRPGRKPGKDGKISTYMRKKQERLREEEATRQRLLQARREEEMRRQQSLMASSSFGTFCEPSPGGLIPKVEPDIAMDDDDPAMALFNDLADMLGPDDQIRDDVDLTPVNSINFLSHLDAGEREIVELMNNGSGYFHEDDLMTGLGAGSTSQSPMYSSFTGSHPSTMRSSISPVKTSASSSGYSSTGEPYTDDKKRKKVMFSSTTDTSLHGRPRKLTDRAAQKVQQTMEKMTKKRDDELEERTNWCFCGRPDDYSEMIGCDNSKCQYQWYHMICVKVEEPPAGLWYCPSCQPNRSQAALF